MLNKLTALPWANIAVCLFLLFQAVTAYSFFQLSRVVAVRYSGTAYLRTDVDSFGGEITTNDRWPLEIKIIK